MASSDELSDEQLRALYAWIDAIPLSRPKRNIARDFSDGVMFAEVVAAYFPLLVELHNYAPANSVKQKVYNFETLNARVLRKLNYMIPRTTIDDIVNGKPGSVELVLNALQFKMAKYRERKSAQEEAGEVSSPSPAKHAAAPQQPKSGTKAPRQPPQPTRSKSAALASVEDELLLEKEQQIRELQETVEILELKIAKLEQLVRLKDAKIAKLTK
jgi:hypothetical protein